MKDHDHLHEGTGTDANLGTISKNFLAPCYRAGDKIQMYYGRKDAGYASDATAEDTDDTDDTEENSSKSNGKFDGGFHGKVDLTCLSNELCSS